MLSSESTRFVKQVGTPWQAGTPSCLYAADVDGVTRSERDPEIKGGGIVEFGIQERATVVLKPMRE